MLIDFDRFCLTILWMMLWAVMFYAVNLVGGCRWFISFWTVQIEHASAVLMNNAPSLASAAETVMSHWPTAGLPSQACGFRTSRGHANIWNACLHRWFNSRVQICHVPGANMNMRNSNTSPTSLCLTTRVSGSILAWSLSTPFWPPHPWFLKVHSLS